MQIYRLEGKGGTRGAIIAILAIGAGLVIVTFGLALLLVVSVAGALIGSGILLYRRLTGKPLFRVAGAPSSAATGGGLEVFAEDAVVANRAIRELPESPPPG